jgi:hypothetical protein
VSRRFLLRGLAFWPTLPVLAVLNGLLREKVMAPALGPAALPLSGVLFAALVLGASAAFLALVRTPHSPRDLWALGGLWAGLALVFEVVLFGLVAGVPAAELRAAFDPSGGNLFALVILATLVGPRLMEPVVARRR